MTFYGKWRIVKYAGMIVATGLCVLLIHALVSVESPVDGARRRHLSDIDRDIVLVSMIDSLNTRISDLEIVVLRMLTLEALKKRENEMWEQRL
jgi:hypothetical protein